MKVIRFYCFMMCILLSGGSKAQLHSNSQQFDKDKSIFGIEDESLNNFTGSIYYLPPHTAQLPDFCKLNPVGEIFTNLIYVEEQSFTNGFPGVTDRYEYFAIDYKGKFYLKDSAYYCFLLASDDGSKLLIDNNLVIDNDYQHSLTTKTNCVSLSKGLHKIEVQYFQGPRDRVGLILRYKKIDEDIYQIFNLAKFHPISVSEFNNKIDISIGDEILFDFNSYELNEKAKYVLTEIKRILIDKNEIKSIIIEGHTDNIGSRDYNLSLSEDRAQSVKRFLIESGVESNYIITKAYGEAEPKFPNSDEENRKKNRRIEMRIMKLN